MNCQDCNQTKHFAESALAMAERTIRRLWITILLLVVLLAGMAIGFFAYEAQFEDCIETTETETEVDAVQFGEDNFVAGGDINYGTVGEGSENADNNKEAESP